VETNSAEPVPGAHVSLVELPNVQATSDPSGRFKLRATHNFHLLTTGGICGLVGWPPGQHYTFLNLTLVATNRGYDALRVPLLDCVSLEGANLSERRVLLRDVPLRPSRP